MEFEKWLKELNKVNRWIGIRTTFVISILAFTILFILFSKQSISLWFFLLIILTLTMIANIDKHKVNQVFSNIDTILYQDCDAKKYLLIVSECYNAFLQGKLNSYGFIIHDLEQRYCIALLVNDNIEEAINFLKFHATINHRSQLYRCMVFQTLFMKAWDCDDCSSYPTNPQIEFVLFRKYPLYRARKYILFQKYEKAIHFLNAHTTHSVYEEVMKHYLLGLCYRKTKEYELAKTCDAYVQEHRNTLLLHPMEQENLLLNSDFKEEHHIFSFICEKQHIKNRMKKEHVVFMSMGYIGCFTILWMILIYLLFFHTKTYTLATYLTKGLPDLFFVMVIALIASVLLIYICKKKNELGTYKVHFYQDYARIENEYGAEEQIEYIEVRTGYYVLVTDENKRYEISTDQLHEKDITAFNRYVKEKHLINLNFIFHRILYLIGIFSFLFMAIFSYQTYIVPRVQNNVEYATIDYKFSKDRQYEIRLEAYADEKNKTTFHIQLYKDGYNVHNKNIVVQKDFNAVTKNDWQVSFQKDAIYVEVCKKDKIKLPYIGREEDEKDSTSKIEMGYKAIYQQFFENQGYSYIDNATAKGFQSILLFEDENRVVFMSYDHDSANEKCGIYVVLESQKDDTGNWNKADAIIQDFYAYEYDRGICVRGDKHDWSQSGNKEYVELSGEW